MRLTVKEKFILAEINKTERSTRIVLGDLKFKGSMTVFVDPEQIEGLKEMSMVEVDMTLNTEVRRVHDRKSEKPEFLEVIRNVYINEIKEVNAEDADTE